MNPRIKLGAFGRGRGRVAAVTGLLAAFNARDLDTMRAALSGDFRHVDTIGRPVGGRSTYLTALEAWFDVMPDAEIVLETIDYVRGDVIARGRLLSPANGLDAPTVWRAAFDGHAICELRVLRDGNVASLSSALRA